MFIILQVVLFLLWINALPSLMAVFLKGRFHYPVDGGKCWLDGRPLLGENKTIRGVISSVAGGIVVFPLLGEAWWVAGIAAILAMVGDLLTSFIKRRAGFFSGKNIVIWDQFLEAFLPLIFLHMFVGLTWVKIFIILISFITVAYISSRLWLYIVERPIPPDYPRVIKSEVRFREWRACHIPLARWQSWFNLTSVLSDQILLTWFFKITGLYKKGEKNTMDIRLEEKTLFFQNLPSNFEGYRVLLLTDLHLDGVEGLVDKVVQLLEGREIDLCLIGGDIRYKTYGEISECVRRMQKLIQGIQVYDGFLGVLGNHDCIEMLPDFEETGVIMLVNDCWFVERDGEFVWIMGVDDPHYYRLDDAREAARGVPQDAFSLFLAHSPEAYTNAAEIDADLYLCGHTHGGQICMTNGKPIFTNSRAPRFTAVGEWLHGGMKGYTSRGLAPSSIPIRFNCPGEVSVITLSRKT